MTERTLRDSNRRSCSNQEYCSVPPDLSEQIPGSMTSDRMRRRYGRIFILVEQTDQNGKREAK